MRYIIYGKNLEVTEGLKQAVHDKFSKLIMMWRPPRETVEVLTCLPPWVIPVRMCPCEELTTR